MTARTVGWISLLSGVILYVHTALRFGTGGNGIPSPTNEPEELVTGGIYACVRNPMHVAVILVITEQAFLLRSVAILWWAAGFGLAFISRSSATKNHTSLGNMATCTNGIAQRFLNGSPRFENGTDLRVAHIARHSVVSESLYRFDGYWCGYAPWIQHNLTRPIWILGWIDC